MHIPVRHLALPPGTYTLRATLAGFQEQVRSGLALLVGQELDIDLTMSLAGVAETIAVTSEAPLVDHDESDAEVPRHP
ncbi:MAG TPA: carboxypeptidase-like regulatory domain-containing protein [Vicinamibacterales bacterium]|nr:carboxypeptidase-like regulatory domain-containing protein [Vicinamibacterales bacterium]